MATNPMEPVLVQEVGSSECVPQEDQSPAPGEDMTEDSRGEKRRRLGLLSSIQELHDVAKETDEETFVMEWCASLNIVYNADDWSASLRQ